MVLIRWFFFIYVLIMALSIYARERPEPMPIQIPIEIEEPQVNVLQEWYDRTFRLTGDMVERIRVGCCVGSDEN
jgi:hypothetical protein